MNREVHGGGQETPATAWTNATRTAEVAAEDEEARGKTRTTIRHNKRNAKRQRMENATDFVQNQPGDLVILTGGTYTGRRQGESRAYPIAHEISSGKDLFWKARRERKTVLNKE